MKFQIALGALLAFVTLNVYAEDSVYQQTTDYTCEASSIINLLHYQNKIPTSSLNRKTELSVAHAIGTTNPDGAITKLELQYLADHGNSVIFKTKINSVTVNQYLDEGYLIMTEMHMYNDLHWIVISNKTENGYITLDSALPDGKRMSAPALMSHATFNREFIGNAILVKSI